MAYLPTNTSTAGIFRPRTLGGRNQHLLPEIHARAKRMLLQAQQEMINANSSVVMQLCEVWRIKRNGAACSCTKEAIEAEVEESKDSYLDLKAFLMNKELTPLSKKERCPVCFGSGFSGGFDLQGATLVTLDALNVGKMKNAAIVEAQPWWIETTTGESRVSWYVTIPKYAVDVYGVCIKWKNEPTDYSVELNGEPISAGGLIACAGKRVKITVRVRDGKTKDAGIYAIFLYFVTGSTLVNVDLPHWTKGFSGSLRIWEEVNESVTANFDARVKNLTPQDIFILKEGFIYRIVEVEYNRPLEVNISWNCQANLVRPNQHYYILPSKMSLSMYPCPNTTFIL